MHYLKKDSLLERITVNPLIMTGKPTVRGTRLTVDHIVKAVNSGLSYEDMKLDFPFLEEEDLEACILYNDIQIFKNLNIEPYYCNLTETNVIYDSADMYVVESRKFIVIGSPCVDGIEFRIKYNSFSTVVFAYYPIEDKSIKIADSPNDLVDKWKMNKIIL
jgi:uncharacterized protein (DUF433 family)